jgi:hypothetical protein
MSPAPNAPKDLFYVGNEKGISLIYDQGQHFNFLDNFAIGQLYEVSVDKRDPYPAHRTDCQSFHPHQVLRRCQEQTIISKSEVMGYNTDLNGAY